MKYQLFFNGDEMPFNDDSYKFQHTINNEINLSGVGVHSGRKSTISIKPAHENSGITFFRSDLPGHNGIKAIFKNVTDTSLATVIGNGGEVIVSTIEHLMAALSAMNIDNANIYIDNHELPILDGSANTFCESITNAGLSRQNSKRNYFVITVPIEFEEGDKFVGIYPSDNFKISCKIEFANKIIGNQELTCEITPETFIKEIGRARTFGLMSDVNMMNLMGLGRGGSLDSAIVVDEDKVLNPEGLRFDNEFVRHKILDCVGDFSLLGMPILGHVKTFKSGHDLHRKFLTHLFNNKKKWKTKQFS